jgi:DNA repair photolyase
MLQSPSNSALPPAPDPDSAAAESAAATAAPRSPASSPQNHWRRRLAPYVLSVDPYTGCDLDCALCGVAELQPMDRPATTFSRFVTRNRERLAGGWIKIGEGCEAYPVAEASCGATRQILEVAARMGLGVEVFTRSSRLLADLDLLRALERRGALQITVKIPPAPRALTLALEPNAPPAPERFELVRELVRRGLPVGVEGAPIMPGAGDDRRSLGHLICAADEVGAGYVRVKPLRLAQRVRVRLLERVEEVDPDVATRIWRCFGYRPWSPGFAERVQTCAASLRRTYGMDAGPILPPVLRPGAPLESANPTAVQLGLFEAA